MHFNLCLQNVLMINMKYYNVVNTCAFDSLSQIVLVLLLYNKTFSDQVLKLSSQHGLFKFDL